MNEVRTHMITPEENHRACNEICNALGLKNVVSLSFHLTVNKHIVIEVEYYPELDAVDKIKEIFKKYKLEEIHD
jgi:hypothetical protein